MLIDVNAAFGGRESVQRFPLATMLEQLQRIGCSIAFVSCNQGATDASAANDQVLALCQQHPWLRPVGTIDPRETFSWRNEVERCLAAGVRLFRIYPEQAHWSPDTALFAPVIERLAGTGAVLLTTATTHGLPTRLAAATAEAGVPIIFSEARYYPLAELLPLARQYPHVFIETSRITSPEGIERCVETLGADRLLFGSGTARYPARVALQVLEQAAISPEAREAIAWRNASRLLGIEPPSSARTTERQPRRPSELRPAIDVHLHDRFPGAPIEPVTPERFQATLDRCAIAGGAVSSVTGIFYDLAQGNDEVTALLDAIPRLRGYVVVDPRYPDASARELERLERDPRFVGVKIHCSYAQTPTASPSLKRLFRRIAAYERPVLIHPLGSDWPEALVEIAGEHPRLPVIAAHAGYGDAPGPTHDAAIRLAPAPNIYLEFCSTYLTTGAIRRGIEAVGPERVLFGSDYPLISLPYMRAAYEDAELSPAETEAILWRNALRLFPALAEVAVPAPTSAA